MKSFLLVLCSISLLSAQTFRFDRPVPDNIQTNGSYLYGEPRYGNSSLAHTGIDISIRYDTVRCATDGSVWQVAYNPSDTVGGAEPTGCGNYLFIRSTYNGRYLYHLYCHLKYPLVKAGDVVKVGTPLAISGTTGNSTGPHLHFELRMNDPYYSSSRSRRNAELWAAMTGMGAIYGKVPGASNSTRVDISPDPKPRPPYTTYGYSLTYNFADPAIGSDDAYQENYAIGDVKPGNYTITALSGSYRRTVTVKAGQVVNADAPAGFVREDIPPDGFELFQNFPNPFNPTTTIRFALAATSLVKLTVYDLLGRELEVLVDEELSPGTYTIPWNASGMGSGIYFYQLRAGNFQKTMSMMLVR